jgi:hypothetical protein
MNRPRTALASFLVLMSGHAMAESVYLCDGCNMASESITIAARQGDGSFSLVDIEDEKIATFQIQTIYEEGVWRYFTKPIKTPIDTLSIYNEVIF